MKYLLIFLLLFTTSCSIHQHYTILEKTEVVREPDLPDPVFNSAIFLRSGKSTASGVVFKIEDDNTAWAISAKHFCEKTSKKIDVYVSPHKSPKIIHLSASVSKVHKFLDLCMLKLSGDTSYIQEIKFSKKTPHTGMRIHTIGAPAGVWPVKTTGYMVGLVRSTAVPKGYKKPDALLVAIPSYFGSSGCPIYNDNGEMLGIIIAVNSKYHHNSLGVGLSPINEFINSFFENP